MTYLGPVSRLHAMQNSPRRQHALTVWFFLRIEGLRALGKGASLRIRSLKNKGFEVQTLVIEGSTPSKQGPRILRADEQFG